MESIGRRPSSLTSVMVWLPLAFLGILAALAERVLAQPCVHDTKLDFFDCEQAHHNGTAAATGATVGTFAAGTGVAPDPNAQTILRQIEEDKRKQEMEKWKIQRETQTKLHDITQDITVNKAKTADKAWDRWQDYIRN